MLEKINQPKDIKKLSEEQLPALAEEIREFLVRKVSKTGGHLASNLGAVELTIALHRVYNLPKDKIVWDVGHQAYTHKILTGRKEAFDHLRQEGGISGFPRREESDCDSLNSGHSSNSISVALGYVRARDLQGEDYKVAAVIGDGALTGGMAFEAMNNAASLKTNLVIVLNDNEMSISRNVGGMSRYLSDVRTSAAYTGIKMGVSSALQKIPGVGKGLVDAMRRTKGSIKQLIIPGMFFENMGLTYLGPVNGHDIRQVSKVLKEAKRFAGPVLVHVVTEKGRGYRPAERHPSRFHGIGAFELETGLPVGEKKTTYTDVFASAMRKLGEQESKLAAVTAAMAEGTGLKRFAEAFPDRYFDVGIAEEHAVTFAAGLAMGGLIPVVAIYSTFLQRAYDQIMEDVCMQNLHVIFAIDRAGLVGADGKTHQGVFDLSYLSMLPNMKVLAPKNKWELTDMMEYAVTCEGPVAIRYPKGAAFEGLKKHRIPVETGKAEVLRSGSHIALLAVGAMVPIAEQAAAALETEGKKITVVNVRFVKPMDEDLLKSLVEDHFLFVTMEENVATGGFGSMVTSFVQKENLPVQVAVAAVPDRYINHGFVDSQRKQCGLDLDSILELIEQKEKNGSLF